MASFSTWALARGRNLAHYGRSSASRVIGVDPCKTSLSVAARCAAALGIAFEPVEAKGEELPLARGSIDSIIVAFTLCTIPDVARALSEARRVLRPDGALFYCEHGLSQERGLARLQRLCNPVWRAVFGGCQVVRDPVQLLQRGGFRVTENTTSRGKGAPPPVANHFCGVAVPG